MIIGVPKEIKNCENRVSLIPSSVKTLVNNDNVVYIEKGAGSKIGFSDELYEQAGAKILETSREVYEKTEIIVKVKELQKEAVSLEKLKKAGNITTEQVQYARQIRTDIDNAENLIKITI